MSNDMDTNEKELNTKELNTKELNIKEINIKELEKANGCGPITGFSKFGLPPRHKNTDKTESEQKSSQALGLAGGQFLPTCRS